MGRARARSRRRWWRSGVGWGGMLCLTAGETDQRRAAERRSPRSSHPAAFGARKNASPGFPIPTCPIPLPMNLRTRTACPSMNLRPRSPWPPLVLAIFAPVAASHTPSESSFSLLRSLRAVLPDAIPGLSSSSLLLVLSSSLHLHAVRTRRAHPMAGNCSCAPSGERRTRVVWRRSWSSSIHDVTGTENPSLLATATRRDTRGLYAVYVYANDYYVGFSR